MILGDLIFFVFLNFVIFFYEFVFFSLKFVLFDIGFFILFNLFFLKSFSFNIFIIISFFHKMLKVSQSSSFHNIFLIFLFLILIMKFLIYAKWTNALWDRVSIFRIGISFSQFPLRLFDHIGCLGGKNSHFWNVEWKTMAWNWESLHKH